MTPSKCGRSKTTKRRTDQDWKTNRSVGGQIDEKAKSHHQQTEHSAGNVSRGALKRGKGKRDLRG